MSSITKRGKGYRILVSNGYNSAGKKIQETATFIPDAKMTPKQQEKALEKFAYEFEQRVKNGLYLDGEKITFKEFVERWLEEYAPTNIEKTTMQTYSHNLNTKIIPALGHIKIAKLQPMHLQSLYNNLLEDGVRQDGKPGGYSPATIKKCHVIISSILSTAVNWQIIETNPCERVSPPKNVKSIDDIKYFTLEQSQTFLDVLDMDFASTYKAHDRVDDTGKAYHVSEYTETRTLPLQLKVFFYLALFGGLRRGEMIALTWNDVDTEKHTVNINKSTALLNNTMITKAPKNKTSIREISLPVFVSDLLKKLRLEQRELQLKLGDQWLGENFIFIQWNGKQMNLSTPYHAFKDIINKYNATVEDESLKLPLIPLHGLRHTSATLLIAEHADVRTVSGRLGHAQTTTTMNIYAHSLKESDKKAADSFENMFKINA